MGSSDVTTEAVNTGNGEVVDAERPVASNGHAAKKRKRQQALAAVAANGHVSKVAQRKPAGSNGAVIADEPPVADDGEDGLPDRPTVEVPEVEAAVVEELDEAEPEASEDEDPLDEPPADGGRRARKRAAKRAAKAAGAEVPLRGRAAKRAAKADRGEAPLRGRAAKRAKAARLASPAARRAELVATAAEIAAAAAAEAESRPDRPGRRRAAKVGRRVFAVLAVAMIPSSVYALAVTDGPTTSLSRADAKFMGGQLMTADQRVRRQLVRLKPRQTSAAVARTRDATLTARSLELELAKLGGRDADLLRRALKLESAWLDAVGSVLANPRSPLREELVARDALLRPALNALPVREGRRKGGARHLVRYAKSRVAAKRRR